MKKQIKATESDKKIYGENEEIGFKKDDKAKAKKSSKQGVVAPEQKSSPRLTGTPDASPGTD